MRLTWLTEESRLRFYKKIWRHLFARILSKYELHKNNGFLKSCDSRCAIAFQKRKMNFTYVKLAWRNGPDLDKLPHQAFERARFFKLTEKLMSETQNSNEIGNLTFKRLCVCFPWVLVETPSSYSIGNGATRLFWSSWQEVEFNFLARSYTA